MKWTEETARAAIARNNGIVGAKTVYIERPGIKILGAIDYLTSKHKYWRSPEPFGGKRTASEDA